MSEVRGDDLWTLAPEGQVYVCGACGKTSRNQAGFVQDGSPQGGPSVASPGWDESCMLNAVLCFTRGPDDTEWRPVPAGWSALTCGRPYVHDCQCPKCIAKPAHETRGWEPK